MMRFSLVALFLIATSMECSPAGAAAVDFQKQYEAAMTKIFCFSTI
jgi:hypothetical protein